MPPPPPPKTHSYLPTCLHGVLDRCCPVVPVPQSLITSDPSNDLLEKMKRQSLARMPNSPGPQDQLRASIEVLKEVRGGHWNIISSNCFLSSFNPATISPLLLALSADKCYPRMGEWRRDCCTSEWLNGIVHRFIDALSTLRTIMCACGFPD